MRNINHKFIKDYILKKCSPKRVSLLRIWLHQAPENGEKLFWSELAYRLGKRRPVITEAAINRAETAVLNEIHHYETHRLQARRLRILRYAAAGLLLIAGGATALWATYNHIEQISITASAGKTMELTLPDNTKVWLNKGGTISYPKEFDDDERRVELSSEALFCVAKNPNKPFIVSSQGACTRVLGTTFNFNTRCQGNSEEVSLLEGSLEITGTNGEGKVVIQPNQKAIIDKTKHTMEVKDVYAPLEAVWHDGMIPFRSMSIRDIAHVLEDLYDVEIDFSAGLDRHSTYSGYIRRGDTIDNVLNALAYSVPFTYKRKDKSVTLYGRAKSRVLQSCP